MSGAPSTPASTSALTSASASTPALNLLHLQPDRLRLAAWAARHRLLDASGDLGYALHALLRAAFGTQTPKSFRYLDAEQGLLAYTELSAADLQHVAALAPPDVAAALGFGATDSHAGLSVRAFPTQWPLGHELAFEVRLRPVVREGRTGRERDVFLDTVEKSPGRNASSCDRGQVYEQWLREQLARQGGAELLDATLERFRLLDVMRKTQKGEAETSRREHTVAGPDAVLSGHLRVADAAAFAALLARGIGRHRAFGFGLLLLRPARR